MKVLTPEIVELGEQILVRGVSKELLERYTMVVAKLGWDQAMLTQQQATDQVAERMNQVIGRT